MNIDVPCPVAAGSILIAMLLSGCMSMSGIDGESHYACPAPHGVQCGSVTANYLQSLRGDRPEPPQIADAVTAPESALTATVTTAPFVDPGADTPRYVPPRILKLWVAPWEDRDGVLHDAAFVFVPLDRGHWQLGSLRPAPALPSRATWPLRSGALTVPANTGRADPAAALPNPPSPVPMQDNHAP